MTSRLRLPLAPAPRTNAGEAEAEQRQGRGFWNRGDGTRRDGIDGKRAHAPDQDTAARIGTVLEGGRSVSRRGSR